MKKAKINIIRPMKDPAVCVAACKNIKGILTRAPPPQKKWRSAHVHHSRTFTHFGEGIKWEWEWEVPACQAVSFSPRWVPLLVGSFHESQADQSSLQSRQIAVKRFLTRGHGGKKGAA